MPCHGLGCAPVLRIPLVGDTGLGITTPAEGRFTHDPDAQGLGALPGPGLLSELQAVAQSVFTQFVRLESTLMNDQQRLLEAEKTAIQKNQGRMANEISSAYRASVKMLTSYRQTKGQLQQAINQIAASLTALASGSRSWVVIVAESIQLGSSLAWTLRSARELIVDIPRFSFKVAELVERARAANVLAPQRPPVSFTQAFGLQNIAQVAPWVVGGLALVILVPRFIPARR